jgi:transcriptional regulator with XRE-family HTH domain
MYTTVDRRIVETTAFQKWLLDEMQARDMSIRQFGAFTGVNFSTLTKLLAAGSDDSRLPSVRTLAQLAEATQTDICSLIALLVPNATTMDAASRILAERIRRLPPDGQAVVEQWLLGRSLQSGNKTE